MSDQMFALDIGTRSVVGLLMEKVDNQYQLLDYYVIEHEERSMLDGQIHDIVSVSNVIQRVKSHLEQKHGITLNKACVAAAGRALKTKRTHTTKNIVKQPLLNEEDVLFLELDAVQKAQYQLAEEKSTDKENDYYCVGYSVLKYYIDQEEIGSLIDQQGDEAMVEIIATFLPKIVVESLLSALHRANLQLEALTLEPIAAIHVLIPPSMRRLNVALVDIGAGTSDIALTSEGAVTAYGMVPKAGDEITEAISDHYLLDFNQAEVFKKEITKHKTAKVQDILGFEQEVSYKDLAEVISPAVDNLTNALAEEMLTLNGTPPKAVMLVGGGSQTPELAIRLANKLKLPSNRVAIRGVDAITLLKQNDDMPIGPEFITPIGIAIAAKQNPVHYVTLTVNDRTIRLFEMKQLTVADSLLAAGIQVQKLYGRPGMAYMIDFNGKQMTLPGSFGQGPTIYVNQQKATIDTIIHDGDNITITKGVDGTSPEMTIGEFIGQPTPITIYFNQKEQHLSPRIFVNQKKVGADYLLQDGDQVSFKQQFKVQDVLKDNRIDKDINNSFIIWVNNEQMLLEDYSKKLVINGKPASKEQSIKNGDRIDLISNDHPLLEDILLKLNIPTEKTITVTYNHEPLVLTKSFIKVSRNGKAIEKNARINDQDKLEVTELKEEPFLFQDLFRHISLDLANVKGKVILRKNGEKVSFLDELKANDEIEIILD